MHGALPLATAAATALLIARRVEAPFQHLAQAAEAASRLQRATDARLAAYWHTTAAGLFAMRVDDAGRFVLEAANPAFERLLGPKAGAPLGAEASAALPSAAAGQLEVLWRDCVAAGRPSRTEVALDLPGGTAHWDASVAPVQDEATGRVVPLARSVRDVTELRRSAEELARLSGHLQAARDEERRRIARDLHDQTAQGLLAASLAIGAARRQARDLGEAADRLLEESRAMIEGAQAEIRTLSYLLHPPLLDEAGVGAAVAWYADGFSRRTGLRVVVEAPEGGSRLSCEAETALFRIAQEALGNVHRHAGASQAWVRLTSPDSTPGEVRLTIRDDGCGIGHEVMQTRPGVGLLSMRERMRNLGGRLSVGRAPQGGTLVEAVLPLAAVSADAAAA